MWRLGGPFRRGPWRRNPLIIPANSRAIREPTQAQTLPLTDLPDTVLQLHEVCRSVFTDGKDLSGAISATAYKFKVRDSTVRDEC